LGAADSTNTTITTATDSTNSSSSSSSSPHQNGLLILDPLQPENNVGKNCYRVSKLLREFSDFLSFLTALIVRGGNISSKPEVEKDESETTIQKNVLPILSRVFDMVTSSSPGGLSSTTAISTGWSHKVE
jgi:hypothetical protein